MQDKIKFYEEILALEPGSKLFYPLARLYLEDQELEKARQTLTSGLEKHPEFLQSRLLLLEVLSALDKQQELEQHLGRIWSQLGQSQEFWRLSADLYRRQGDPDLAVAVSYLGRALQGDSPGWVQLLQQALQQDQPTAPASPAQVEPEPDSMEVQDSPAQAAEDLSAAQEQSSEVEQDQDQAGPQEEQAEESPSQEEQYKTPTMAEILAEQGDLQGALDIYSWLLEQTESGQRREQLQSRMQELQQQIQAKTGSGAEDPRQGAEAEPEDQEESGQELAESGQEESQPEDHASASKQTALINRLQKLASRLEARGQDTE
ncbi:MAG: hypothetical protein ACOCYY_02775 [Desulfohalobiaceae bacterium]